jgi:hypothetical protein
MFWGHTAKRGVVADKGRVVVVCNEEEYASARANRRKPDGIGFPREAVRPLTDSTIGREVAKKPSDSGLL